MFKRSIPYASYQYQLLHGMASAGALNHAFYVVASLQKIIRVVHVRVGSLIREQYLSVISNLGRRHLNWIEEGVVPAMTFEAGSHAVDHHSVQCTLDLWRALCNLIQEQQRPLLAGLPLNSRGDVNMEYGQGSHRSLQSLSETLQISAFTSWSAGCNLVEVDHDMCLQCIPRTQFQFNSFISS